MNRRIAAVAALTAAAALTIAGCTSDDDDGGSTAAATSTPTTSGPTSERPPAPDTWVVSLGDSYIAGEGARFAGNSSDGESAAVDALGPAGYADGDLGEAEPGCHRAEVWPGLIARDGVGSRDLACSGAQTETFTAGSNFKPGVDFYQGQRDNVGQLVALEEFVSGHDVSDVVVSVGGNDVGFGEIVTTCVGSFLAPGGAGTPCSDNPALAAKLTPAALDRVADDIAGSLTGVSKVMRSAGYQSGDYAVTVATYPSPLPEATDLRYTERQRRNDQGGCPFFDVDANWANQVVLPAINRVVVDGVQGSGLSNVGILDVSDLLIGHRLCERGVSLLEETDAASWEAPGVSEQVEWVNGLAPDLSNAQEALHPNYWGTQALRACYTAATAGVDARTARCVLVRAPGAAEQPARVRLVQTG